jgi:copper chaperone CopZ
MYYEFIRSAMKIFYILVLPILSIMELFKKTKSSDNYNNLTVKVSGMHCKGCAHSIEESLSKVNDIRNVKADFQNAYVKMEFNQDKVELEKIRRAIRKAGFVPGVEKIG